MVKMYYSLWINDYDFWEQKIQSSRVIVREGREAKLKKS